MNEEAEEQARSAAVSRAANSAFPESHLSPWMSSYNYKIMVALAKMATIARIAEKADRNNWRDKFRKEHEGKDPTSADMAKAAKEALDSGKTEEAARLVSMIEAQKKDEQMAEDFDLDLHARGAAAAYAYGVNSLVQEVHDRAVSVGQLGRKQAIALAIGTSTRAGPESVSSFEPPKKAHFWSRTPKQETAGLR